MYFSHFGTVLDTQSFKKFRDYLVDPLYSDSQKIDLIKRNVKNNAPFYMAMKKYMKLDKSMRGDQQFSDAMERYYPSIRIKDIGIARPMTGNERRDRMDSSINDVSNTKFTRSEKRKT